MGRSRAKLCLREGGRRFAAFACLFLALNCGSGGASIAHDTATRPAQNPALTAADQRLLQLCSTPATTPCTAPFCRTGCVGGEDRENAGCVAGCTPNPTYTDAIKSTDRCRVQCEMDLNLAWYATSAVDAGNSPERERARCAATCAAIVGETDADAGGS